MWSQLTVGTVVKLRNRETAPADLLILSVDEQDPRDPTGICYVETKSLDGETNLKLRQACDLTIHAGTAAKIAALRGYLRCENPNRAITRFDGTLAVEDASHSGRVEQQPVNIKNIILRGCQLRNTEWMYGLVVNTGSDTKIVQSMDKPRPKWSSINEMVNKMLLWVFIAQMSLCVIGATTQIMWLTQDGGVPFYLHWEPSLFKQWLIGVGYYFLLLYQMIPISLYVTISIVMLMQAFFMTFDLDMYHDETDSPMKVRSMGLNEELGQISYVFSDKTGTLTCNVMEFRKCSINGVSYGTGTTEIGRAALRRRGVHVPDEGDAPRKGAGKRTKIPNVNFEDPRLHDKLARTAPQDRSREAEFFLHLSLCHTVIPEVVAGSDEIGYSASSPDEQALVCGARFMGCSFESRGLGVARVRVFHKCLMLNKALESELLEFKVLEVLEFTSERKRMSTIVQHPNGEIWLLTKGADNVIYPLLDSTNDSDLLQETTQHLDTFGDDGLRTLTIARRILSQNEYEAWSQSYKAATTSLEEIEKRRNGEANQIDALMEQIEKDLELLGATAIEDKLQQYVPRTIANLMRGGVKVWMLTGDKQETAINISYACQLMDNDMEQIVLNLELFNNSRDKLYSYLADCNQAIGGNTSKAGVIDSPDDERRAVVIDGECLEVTLLDERCRSEFISLALRCEAVVCCRVSPSQKAEVVMLVRAANPKARTLSIGDGANDVAMIQRAHVGVGISGQEGMQAVNASDYAIAQFHFLEKLLLHHGRLNYKRMSMLVPYMFYKNTIMVVAQYFFMFSTGSSAQKFYSEFAFQLYNLLYTSIPIGVLGVFDYDVPWAFARKFPELYQVGPRRELFNYKTFGMWVLTAYYDAALICFISLYCFNEQRSNDGSAPLLQYGIVTFTLVVLVSSLKFVVIQMSWTIQGGLLWFFSVLCYLPTSIWLSGRRVEVSATDYGQFENTLHHPSYWLTIVLGCVGIIIQNFAVRAIQRRFYPQPWHIVQELFVLEKSGVKAPAHVDIEAATHHAALLKPEPAARRRSQRDSSMSARSSSSRRQRMSSFAFSFDPETTAAESFMASHSVHDVSTAIHEAETHCRVSQGDLRASDYRMSQSLVDGGESPHRMQRILSASSLSPSETRHSQPGLFTW
ncbi:hypothetical protein PINS_up006591 [Pythium insidiosum]|nr:hypothetical protein PINS_up006591 [Pythium insidiosum]